MKKRLRMNVMLLLSAVFSVWMFALFLRYAVEWGIATSSYQRNPERLAEMEQYFGNSYLMQCIGKIVQNALFSLGFFLMSVCLIFLIIRRNNVQLSYAIRYSRERRAAQLEKRKEKKRQRLQEELERISKGHES